MAAMAVAATKPGRLERRTAAPDSGPPMAPLLMLTRPGRRERHPDADGEHLWRLVPGGVEQRDDLDQRQEGDDTDEERHPRLAEERDRQDQRARG